MLPDRRNLHSFWYSPAAEISLRCPESRHAVAGAVDCERYCPALQFLRPSLNDSERIVGRPSVNWYMQSVCFANHSSLRPAFASP